MHKGLSALPLGGAGEVTMSMMVYECDKEMILVDAGLTFPDEKTPGVDLILPDIDYIRKNIKRLKGIVISHGHEDHIGALPYLWEEMPVPVYLTKFANLILEDKLKDVGLKGDVPVTVVKANQKFKLGENFEIEFINVLHSIPETNALAIRTPHGNIFHTTEYKFDETPVLGKKTDKDILKAYGDEGVLAMFGDSTNALISGTSGTESELRESLSDILSKRKNRVFFCCFASHVARMTTALEIARTNNRKVALWGYSVKKMIKYARQCGYIDEKCFDNIISPEEAIALPKNDVMVIVTGSQAQSNAALYKLIRDQIPIKMTQGDTVILSALAIPGNEKPIGEMLNQLAKKGVEAITRRVDFVHVSGHGYKDEIEQMYKLIRPQIAVPIFGDHVQMREHADFAKKIGVPKQFVIENGTRIKLAPEKPSLLKEESASFGRVYVDGLNILDEDRFIIKERLQLSEQGVVTVAFSFDAETGKLNGDPVVKSRGIIDPELQPDLVEDAIASAQDAFYRAFKKNGADLPAIEEAVRISVRRIFRVERDRNPTTIVSGLMV